MMNANVSTGGLAPGVDQGQTNEPKKTNAVELANAEGAPAIQFILKSYSRFLAANFIGALVVSFCLGGIVLLRYGFGTDHGEPSIFLITAFAGTMGAFISSLTRMYKFSDLPEAISNVKFKLDGVTILIYSLVPALVGTVFATIVYFVFAGEMLKGPIFPTFSCTLGDAKGCTTISNLINHYGPATSGDYARMIFWGFVAGFSERLVPDFIGRMESKAGADKLN